MDRRRLLRVGAALMLMVATGATCRGGSSESALPSATPSIAAFPSPLSPSASPTPLPTTRILDIAIDYQDHPLSCEAASLKMALTHEGIYTDEKTLLELIGADTRPAVVDDSGTLVRWGNPNSSFVGDPDGRLDAYTGYGVYAGPVARAARAAGGTVLAWGTNLPPDRGQGIAPATVYQALLGGHPVIAWISATYEDVALSTYTAFDGSTVWYTLSAHVVTLIGVRPDAVLINDPLFGQAWHSKAEFESTFRTLDEMAVILD